MRADPLVSLSFEHGRAAAHSLAGFGPEVEVVSRPAVRDLLLATAQGILDRYGAGRNHGAGPNHEAGWNHGERRAQSSVDLAVDSGKGGSGGG